MHSIENSCLTPSFIALDWLIVSQIQTWCTDLTPTQRPPINVKVSSGAIMKCSNILQNSTWLMEGHTFSYDMNVLELG